MGDPVDHTKAAIEGMVQQAEMDLLAGTGEGHTHRVLDALVHRLYGAADSLARRVMAEAPDVPGTQRDRAVTALARFEEVDPIAAGEAGVGNLIDELVGSRPANREGLLDWPEVRAIEDALLLAGHVELAERMQRLFSLGTAVYSPTYPPAPAVPLVHVREVEGTNPQARTWAVQINGTDVGTVAVDRFILDRDGERAVIRELARYLSEHVWPGAGGVRSMDAAEHLPVLYLRPGTVRA